MLPSGRPPLRPHRPFLNTLSKGQAALRVYELPTLGRRYRLMRSFIDGGMRRGIPDAPVRSATITLYIDEGAVPNGAGCSRVEHSDHHRAFPAAVSRRRSRSHRSRQDERVGANERKGRDDPLVVPSARHSTPSAAVIPMGSVIVLFQVVAALGLLNVWLLRANRRTAYRGADARNMREEFRAYGLPVWMVGVVGALKVGAALALIAGIWYRPLVVPAALLIGALMLGALAMHFRIHDPLRKSAPAAGMLLLSFVIVVGSVYS